MKIDAGKNGNAACIVLKTHEDIVRMHKIFSRGINCMSDRGKDVEEVADKLRESANKVPAHG